ncbi:type III secretion system chaperone [Salmonella enterica]|nr:type III secretion system chaperone [Salmonella enterica]
MESLLNRLYDALGLDAPEDEPLLIIDDGIQVYFNESDHTLEMCCPFMPLPDDILTLQHFLRLNYTSAVTIGADADNTALVALYRFYNSRRVPRQFHGLTWQGVVRVYRVRRHLYDVGYFSIYP